MNLALAHSRARAGVHAPAVRVEVHLGGGLPNFTLVGLPAAAVRESRERVRAAIQNAQFEFPQRRIVVNLAPADLPKEGGRYDLAIALGILAASGQIPVPALSDIELLGELAVLGAASAGLTSGHGSGRRGGRLDHEQGVVASVRAARRHVHAHLPRARCGRHEAHDRREEALA